jgi:hypothetical protein
MELRALAPLNAPVEVIGTPDGTPDVMALREVGLGQPVALEQGEARFAFTAEGPSRGKQK